jgi:hypothetical protein
MSEGGSSARSDLIGGAGWIFFGLAILAGAWQMERFEQMSASLYTMPGFVPGLFGALLVLLGAALALRGWRRQARERRQAMPAPMPPHGRAAAALDDGAEHDDGAAPGNGATGVAAGAAGAGARASTARVPIVLGLCLAYAAVLVGRAPFWLATVLFVTAFTWAFSPAPRGPLQRVLVAALAGVLTTVVVVLVFEQVFLVRLP